MNIQFKKSLNNFLEITNLWISKVHRLDYKIGSDTLTGRKILGELK